MTSSISYLLMNPSPSESKILNAYSTFFIGIIFSSLMAAIKNSLNSITPD